MTTLDTALAVVTVLLTGTAAALLIALRRSQVARRWALASRASAVESQQKFAELAVAAERLRILREMHDVIAHSLAIMIAQADGGSYVSGDAEASKRAFTTIAETGRGALADTRRILGILKHNDEATPDLAPTPDAGLDDLARQYRDAGLAISLIRLGEPRNLPSGTRTALYRITQEALTNVLKHAGEQATVIVSEDWRAEAVALTITSSGGVQAKATDPLTGEALPGLGLGLIGMRERAELLGGELSAGPTAEGFRVRAKIPFRLEDPV
jgi:signal transduction histidine kinase